MNHVKRAYVKGVKGEGGNFNYSFPIENERYNEGDIIKDMDDIKYRVLSDSHICAIVEEVLEVSLYGISEDGERKRIDSVEVKSIHNVDDAKKDMINAVHKNWYTYDEYVLIDDKGFETNITKKLV